MEGWSTVTGWAEAAVAFARARAWLRVALCVVFGALMACATPPMNVYPMAWVGLVLFALMLELESGEPVRPGRWRRWSAPWRGGLRGLAFGFGTNLVALRFVAPVVLRFSSLPSFTGPIALAAISTFEGTRWVVAAIVYGWLVRLGLRRVVAFAMGAYVGSLLPTMIPWTVACGVCPWPATVQFAEIVGERGVAMLMALEAALVAEGIRLLVADRRRPAARAVGGAAALVAATVACGAVRIHQIDSLRAASPVEPIALVEPAVAVSMRWDDRRAYEILARLTDLTVAAERDGAELVIWPEAAYPFRMNHVSRHAPVGREAILQPRVRGPVLTGLVMMGDFGKYNSAVIATRDGMISEPYDKIHLMWFGESVPLGDVFPWLRKAFARGVGLRAGEKNILLESGPVRLAVLNCLEDILPEAGREAMSVDPNLVVNITNDGWFEGSAESELHLRLARLRSVEMRRDLLRAVNLGPTTWVDAVGRIVAQAPPDRPSFLMTRPALIDSSPTLYARFGDLPLSLAMGVFALGVAARRTLASAARAKSQQT